MKLQYALSLLTPLLFGSLLYADTQPNISNGATNNVNNNIDRLLQQEQKRQKVRSKEMEQNVFFERPKVNTVAVSKTPQDCLAIKKINLLDSKLIELRTKNRIIAKYSKKCMSANTINQLINDIGNYYLENGYITSRAFIKEQDLNDGTLDITVIEGKIDNVLIKPSKNQRNITRFAFPHAKGQYLNLRDIEMGIEQISRLKSQDAKSKLLPSKDVGNTDLIVEIQRTKPLHLGLTIDNQGSEGTGKYLVNSNIVWDNPFGMNDKFTVGLNGTNKQETEKGSRGNSIAYQAPYGYSLFDLSYSVFNYKQPILGLNESFISSGKSSNYKASIDRVIHRNKNSKTKLNFAVGHKTSENYISDVLIDTSSRKLTIGSLSLGHTKLFNKGSFNSNISLFRGLKWFGAETDLGGGAPQAQFTKYALNIDYSKQLSQFKKPINVNSSAHIQYSNNRLYGTEQISIGGLYTVRGYENNGLAGNTGWYWRNELSSTYPIKKVATQITPYIAYDIGRINKNDPNGRGDTLTGGALGLRLQGKYFNADFSVARANVRPEDIQEDTVLSASISLNF